MAEDAQTEDTEAEDTQANRPEHLPFSFKVAIGKFRFEIIAGTVEIAKEVIGVGRYVAKAAVVGLTLGAIYATGQCQPMIRGALDSALQGALGVVTSGAQDLGEIVTGSLHFVVRCFKDDRFLDILSDYESGKIKQHLEEEFAMIGIKTTGLEVRIENIEEVEETKAVVNKRHDVMAVGKDKTTKNRKDEKDLLGTDERKLSIEKHKAAAVETSDVIVTGHRIPVEELIRVQKSVCLLRSSTKSSSESWSATGCYINVKVKKENKVTDVHGIMTNYHAFLEMKRSGDLVAVFNPESTGKESFELPLVPFQLLAHSEGQELDYVLIEVDERRMQTSGVKPIVADRSELPTVVEDDRVYIIQHTEGKEKHFSIDTVKCVNKPYMEYYADTMGVSSGFPVFVLKESKLLLVALHNMGAKSSPSNYNKGVLLSDILDHFHEEQGITSNIPLPSRVSDQKKNTAMAFPTIIVQGGAFPVLADRNILQLVTNRAANEGYDVLVNGGTAVDAVEKAIGVFEEHGHFNASYGSRLNVNGEVECDAMIMDGHNLETGAVITARNFRHPVSIARKIMDESPHCALSGDGAMEFARSLDSFHEICAPEELKGNDCPHQQIHVPSLLKFAEFTDLIYTGYPIHKGQEQQENDTVGAVALDCNGYLACGNSSDGIAGKLKGYVSNVSVVGCGGYANEFGAAATTGPGEAIAKMTLAREAVYNMEQGQNAQEAAVNAVRRMKDCVDAYGGVIAIGQDGNIGIVFATGRTVWAIKKNNRLQCGMRL